MRTRIDIPAVEKLITGRGITGVKADTLRAAANHVNYCLMVAKEGHCGVESWDIYRQALSDFRALVRSGL